MNRHSRWSSYQNSSLTLSCHGRDLDTREQRVNKMRHLINPFMPWYLDTREQRVNEMQHYTHRNRVRFRRSIASNIGSQYWRAAWFSPFFFESLKNRLGFVDMYQHKMIIHNSHCTAQCNHIIIYTTGHHQKLLL